MEFLTNGTRTASFNLDETHNFLSASNSRSTVTNRDKSASTTNHFVTSAVIIGDVELYNRMSEILYLYALPVISALGFFGNLMNLIILAGKRIQHSLRTTEKAANSGLIALAVSDLAFCVTAFPSTFLPADMTFDGEPGFLALYACYCAAVISIFIMTSTWLTVAMSAERYLAICHPLGSRRIISLNRTRFVIVVVNVLSAVFNVPLFWRYIIITKDVFSPASNASDDPSLARENLSEGMQLLLRTVDHRSNAGGEITNVTSLENDSIAMAVALYQVASNLPKDQRSDIPRIQTKKTVVRARLPASDSFEHLYRLAWATFGNFIPLLILIFCNVGLLKEIQKSYALRRHMNRSIKNGSNSVDIESSQRITMTLVCIVVMFLVLVAPSEIVKHLAALSGADLEANYHFKTIEVVTNLMQAVNFSANFILYCIVNPSFRRTMREMVRLKNNSLTNNNNSRPPSVTSTRVAGQAGLFYSRSQIQRNPLTSNHNGLAMTLLMGHVRSSDSSKSPKDPPSLSKVFITTRSMEKPGVVSMRMNHSYS